MNLQSITHLASKIERHLDDQYTGGSKDYKTKYRQIYLNLKDEKNDHFWRNVLKGEITTSMLIRMNNQQMASKEKIMEREKQERDDIDRRKKLEEERQKEALQPMSKITHKGEIEIDRDFSEPLEKTSDLFPELNKTPEKTPQKEKKKEKKQKKEKKEKVQKKDEISNAELETIKRMMDAKSKPLKPLSPVKPKNEDEEDMIEEPKTPEYIPPEDNGFEDAPSPQASPEHVPSPEPVSLPPPPKETTKSSGGVNKVWSGKVTFPEASNFSANGYIISGNADAEFVRNALPNHLKVGGKLEHDVVETYIQEVRRTSDQNRISIMSLYGKSAAEQSGYVDSMYFLTNKNKIGVVNNINAGFVKDVYIVPLQENQDIPDFMQPITGSGLTSEHPAILLVLMVKKSEKKKPKPKPEKRKEEAKPEYTPAVPDPVALPEVEGMSNDLFNSIKESLQTVNTQSLVPSQPVVADSYYSGDSYSSVPPLPPPPTLNSSGYSQASDYRADSRDRDSRTFRPEHSGYSAAPDTHSWDNHGRDSRGPDRRERSRHRSSGGYERREDDRRGYRRDDRRDDRRRRY